MGPNVNILSSFVANMGNVFRSEIEQLVDIKQGVFWIVLYHVYAFVALWLFLILLLTLKVFERFPTSGFLKET